jgi:hypothetical protein
MASSITMTAQCGWTIYFFARDENQVLQDAPIMTCSLAMPFSNDAVFRNIHGIFPWVLKEMESIDFHFDQIFEREQDRFSTGYS